MKEDYVVYWVSLTNLEDVKKFLDVRNKFHDTILSIGGSGETYLNCYSLGIYIPDKPEYAEVDKVCWEKSNDSDGYPIDVSKIRSQEEKVMKIVETILNLPEQIKNIS